MRFLFSTLVFLNNVQFIIKLLRCLFIIRFLCKPSQMLLKKIILDRRLISAHCSIFQHTTWRSLEKLAVNGLFTIFKSIFDSLTLPFSFYNDTHRLPSGPSWLFSASTVFKMIWGAGDETVRVWEKRSSCWFLSGHGPCKCQTGMSLSHFLQQWYEAIWIHKKQTLRGFSSTFQGPYLFLVINVKPKRLVLHV